MDVDYVVKIHHKLGYDITPYGGISVLMFAFG